MSLCSLTGVSEAKNTPKKATNDNSNPTATTITLPSASMEAFEAMMMKTKNLTAVFHQETTSASSGRVRESAGRVYISKPNCFRWEVTSPDPSILTSNGERIWYYTPPFQEGDRAQLLVRAAKKDQTQLAISLLAGGESFKKQFDIRRLSSSGGTVYQLKPLKEAGSIKDVELQIENQTNLVYRITLNHLDGGRTRIRFTEISKVPSLPVQMFRFSSPPGVPVDIVDESK